MPDSIDEAWCVMRDIDSGTHVFHPYLSEDHAKRLAALLDEIETARVVGRGGKREKGDGQFFSAHPMPKERRKARETSNAR